MASVDVPVLELVVREGPDMGLTCELSQDEVVPVGRSSKGLRLTDPLVGLMHARVEWREDQYFVVDNGEVESGTHIEDVILMGSARAVGPGSSFKVGETIIEVRKPVQWRRWAYLATAILLGVVIGIGGAIVWNAFWTFWTEGSVGVPVLASRAPVRQAGGVVSSSVPADPIFLRQHGLDVATLSIDRVTDFDYDGIDELWLESAEAAYVVTFTPEGWRSLGVLPTGCLDWDRTLDGLPPDEFPILRCPGVYYHLRDGAYQAAEQESPVVWLASEPGVKAEGEAGLQRRDPADVTVYRISMREVHEPRMAGFLATRGVSGSIAYMICEDALPGIRPQVLTSEGLMPLGTGCLKDVKVSGRLPGRVLAIAFTAGGHQALIDDVSTFYGGNADGMFVPDATRPVIEAWSKAPGFVQGGAVLEFKGSEHFFRTVVPEGPIRGGSRSLLPVPGFEPSPLAATARILSEGPFPLDPPGCVRLRVEAGRFACAVTSGCTSSSRFLQVMESGCTDERSILSVPYSDGLYDAQGATVPVRVAVTTASRPDGIDVLQASISYQVPGASGLDEASGE